jgi:hypothetical protein
MSKEFVFHVKGSEPDPYIIKVSLSPILISKAFYLTSDEGDFEGGF